VRRCGHGDIVLRGIPPLILDAVLTSCAKPAPP
jgi:hypothetical protein